MSEPENDALELESLDIESLMNALAQVEKVRPMVMRDTVLSHEKDPTGASLR